MTRETDRSGLQGPMDRLASGTCRVDCPSCTEARARKQAIVAVILLTVATALAVVSFPVEGRPAIALIVVAAVLAVVGQRLGERSGMDARGVVRMVARWPVAVLLSVALLLIALSVVGLALMVAR